MKKSILYIALLSLGISACQKPDAIHREQDFNFGWKFSLNEKPDATSPEYEDEDWRTVDLPHDWSVEFPFDSTLWEGCTGYLPGGIGWYRKHFEINNDDDQVAYLHFDGVYNNSEYWLNGKKIHHHPYGYSPFYFDLTPHLKKHNENILAIKVDRSRRADSRWYPGSGIYRNVKLIKTNKLHIPIWGTFITTPQVSENAAEIALEIKVKNDFYEKKEFQIFTKIFDQFENKITESKNNFSLEKKTEDVFHQNIEINTPQLWSLNNPNLYTAITSLFFKGNKIDEYSTPFGIRTFRFDPDDGFFLNEKNMKIKGVCLHHDGGLVGAAVPKDVWRRRLQILKSGGCNAIRNSHNPGSQEFLDLCDEMGFLVQDEFFDEWDNPKDKRLNMHEQHSDYDSRGYAEQFQAWAEKDLKNTVLAHRNHPSIIQWSIGNEIEWTYPRARKATGFFDNMNWNGNYFWSQPPFSPEQIKETYFSLPAGDFSIEKTAKKLANWTRELDTTRPIIANCILPASSLANGYADALNIVGFSYRRVMYDYAKKHYPDKVIMGTENLAQWHEWKAVMERPFVSGTFLWTGIDYMGEANEGWPRKGSGSGLLDLAGFPKPSYHMMKSLWTDEPHIYMTTQSLPKSIYKINKNKAVVENVEGAWEQALWSWHDVNEHWNYTDGEMVIVEILSNCEEVELFHNGKSLGKKYLANLPDHIYKWAIPFSSGKLIAKGNKNGEAVEYELNTALKPVSISVELDKNNLTANGYDVAHIVVQLIDENNNPVQHTEREIFFEINGNIKSLGVDNGHNRNVQPYQSNKVTTKNGRALLIVQAERKKGKALITVSGNGLKDAVKELVVE